MELSSYLGKYDSTAYLTSLICLFHTGRRERGVSGKRRAVKTKNYLNSKNQRNHLRPARVISLPKPNTNILTYLIYI